MVAGRLPMSAVWSHAISHLLQVEAGRKLDKYVVSGPSNADIWPGAMVYGHV